MMLWMLWRTFLPFKSPLKVLFIIKLRVSLLSFLIGIFSSKDRGENSRFSTRVLNYRLELNERNEEKEF